MNTWPTDPRAFEALFASSPAGILAADANGRILAANAACARLTGHTVNELLKADGRMILGDAMAAFPQDAYRDIDLIRRDGTIFPARVSSIPIVQGPHAGCVFFVLENITDRLQAERTVAAQREELTDLEGDFHSLFDHNPDGVVALDTHGFIVEANAATLKMSFRPRDAIVGQDFRVFLPEESLDQGSEFLNRANSGESLSYEIASFRGDGTPLDLDVTLVPRYVRGEIVGSYALFADITARKSAQRRDEVQAKRLRDLYLLATTAEYSDAHVAAALETGCRLLDVYSGAIVEGAEDIRVHVRHDTAGVGSIPDEAIVEIAQHVLTQRVPTDHSMFPGSHDPLATWIGTPFSVSGNVHGALLFYSTSKRSEPFEEADLETIALIAALVGGALERRRTRTHLRAMAYYDSLTGLPNRVFFQERLRDVVADLRETSKRAAVLFFDLDSFKDINDTLGHALGDRFLQIVAERLLAIVGERGTVARMGGDEFIVLLPDCGSLGSVREIAQELLDVVEAPCLVESYEQFITTSIGVALFPDDGFDDQTLIKNADIAMYCAKERGRNAYFFYNESLEVPMHSRLAQERRIRAALELDQFVLHYQPIVELATNKVVSVEALVRWNHPELGLIGPDEFISAAESSGLIVELGEWVIYTAAKQMQSWQETYGDICLAVNISARQFHQRDLALRVLILLKKSGLDPRSLELEITESMAISEAANAIDTIRTLKSMGSRIAVDDFGTGHSSLSYLRRFDIDHIKIDRSFVRGIGLERGAETLVKAIVAMGHSLGLLVIAEGVETVLQYDFLCAQGCDRAQGYYLSPALEAAGFERFLVAAGNSRPTGVR